MTLKQKEADVTKTIRDLLNVCGIFHFKHWGGPMSAKGVSDIIGCHAGIFFAIEIKALGKKPKGLIEKWSKREQDQASFLMNVQDAGGIGFFADCIEDVIRELGLENIINGPLFEKSENE